MNYSTDLLRLLASDLTDQFMRSICADCLEEEGRTAEAALLRRTGRRVAVVEGYVTPRLTHAEEDDAKWDHAAWCGGSEEDIAARARAAEVIYCDDFDSTTATYMVVDDRGKGSGEWHSVEDGSRTVKVRVAHRAGRPHTYWVDPVGWTPDISGDPRFGADAEWDGAIMDEDDEVAGMAMLVFDLGKNDPEEGEEIQVVASDIFYLSSGDCRSLGSVFPEKGKD